MPKKGFVPIVIVLIIAFLVVCSTISYIFIKNKQPNIIGEEELYKETTTISTTTTTTIFPTTTTISPTTTTKIVSPITTTTTIVQCEDSVIFTYKGELVTYGTVESQGRCWLDRNLGASRVATAFNNSEAYGDLFQWGRGDDGHQNQDSETITTLSDTDTPGHSNFIIAPNQPFDWRTPQNNNLWQGVSGINNPCPDGWRLPTITEWETELASWSQDDYNGAFASPLKLTAAGSRGCGFDDDNVMLHEVGSFGGYWSSSVGSRLVIQTPNGEVNGRTALTLYFYSGNANTTSYTRAGGFSVRCIKD